MTADCLLPPSQFDHEPKIPVTRTYEAENEADYDCRSRIRSIDPLTGCTYLEAGRVFEIIARRNRAQQACTKRHEDGHLNMLLETGDSSPRHAGWHHQAISVPSD